MNRVLALNSTLKFEELAAFSVGELKDLIEAGAPAMPIGKDKALDIAVKAFGNTTSAQISYSEVDAELDETPAHYEVEIITQSGEEFEYKIDAYTGVILETKREAADGTETPSGDSSFPTLGSTNYAKVKAIILKYLGISENNIYDMNIKLEVEDGTLVYEVEFKSDHIEYSFKINAATGVVLEYEAERDD